MEVSKVVQGKDHGNPKPLGDTLHFDRDRVSSVGPGNIWAIPAEKDVAARQECLGLLLAGPAASRRRVFKYGDGQIAVDGEEQAAFVRSDPALSDFVCTPRRNNDSCSSPSCGSSSRVPQNAWQSKPSSISKPQPVARCCRCAVGEVQNAMRRYKRDLSSKAFHATEFFVSRFNHRVDSSGLWFSKSLGLVIETVRPIGSEKQAHGFFLVMREKS